MEEDSRIQFLPKNTVDTLILSNNVEDSNWDHLQGNFNISHQFTPKATLNFDVDYLGYDHFNQVVYDQSFFTNETVPLKQEALFTEKASTFGIWVGNLTYNWTFSDKTKFDLGVKLVTSDFENDVLASVDENILVPFTDQSDLKETIWASFVQFEHRFTDRTTLKGGLRYEQTDTELITTQAGKTIDRNFGSFFPNLSFQHRLNDFNRFNVSYSKRITRPSFSDMASFVIFLDPNTAFGGDATLQPAIAQTFQVGYQWKTINFNIQYTQEDSTIVRFQNRFDPTTNTQLILPDNLAEQRTFNASVAFPLKPLPWWQMRYFVQYTWIEAITLDRGQTFGDTQGFVFLNSSQTFTLPKQLSIELSGFYNSGRINGNQQFDPFGVINIGISKKLNAQSRLTFNVTDLFNGLEFITTTSIPDFFVRRTFDFSQRTFKLTYNQSFGNQKVKKARSRKSGAEELKRVN